MFCKCLDWKLVWLLISFSGTWYLESRTECGRYSECLCVYKIISRFRHVEYEIILICLRGDVELAEIYESGAQTHAVAINLAKVII